MKNFMNQLCVRYVLSSMYQARMNMHVSSSFMLDSRNRLRSRTRVTIVMFQTPSTMRFIAAIVNVSSADHHACIKLVYAGLAKAAPFSYRCDKFHVSDCIKFEESAPFSYTCHNCYGNVKSKVLRPGIPVPNSNIALFRFAHMARDVHRLLRRAMRATSCAHSGVSCRAMHDL